MIRQGKLDTRAPSPPSLSLSLQSPVSPLIIPRASGFDRCDVHAAPDPYPSFPPSSFLPQSLFGFSGMRRRQHLLWTGSVATAMDGRMDGRVAAVLEILPFNELLIVSGTPLAGVT